MKIKKIIRHLTLSLSLIFMLVFFLAAPAAAQNSEFILAYDNIETQIQSSNLQLKVAKSSLKDLEDSKDAASSAQDALWSLQSGLSSTAGQLESIAENPLTDPDVAVIANSALFSVSQSKDSLSSQASNLNNLSTQIKTAGLSYDKSEKSLINSAKSLFILCHQLSGNIENLSSSRKLLEKQVEISKLSLKQGQVLETDVLKAAISLMEFDSSYSSLCHQRDMLDLQVKALVGLSADTALSLGDLPSPALTYIDSADLQKDIVTAIDNSYDIKIKKAQYNKSLTSAQTNELQIMKNDTQLSLSKQYYTMLEAKDTLTLAELKLQLAQERAAQGKLQYEKGLISSIAYDTLQNDAASQQYTVESNAATVLCEIENYKTMVAGVL